MDPDVWHNDDEALVQELREAVAARASVPDHAMESAKAAFDWRYVDDELELLTLSYDSLLAGSPGVRGPALDTTRMLVFDGEQLTIDLELGAEMLMGQIVPARLDRVFLECADRRTVECHVDDAGFFLLRRPDRGPIRLKCQHGEGAGVVTEWITI